MRWLEKEQQNLWAFFKEMVVVAKVNIARETDRLEHEEVREERAGRRMRLENSLGLKMSQWK